MNFRISLSVIFCIYLRSVTSLYCYWNTGCPYKHMSSKTPYNAARGDIRDSIIKLTDCEPVSIWGVIRHGKRNPGVDYARGMRNALEIRDYVVASYANGNSSLCAQDVENLRDWPLDNKLLEKVHQLADEGHQEAEGLGKRWKQAFPKLLGNLQQGEYVFRPAFGKWMEDSANSFVKGLKNNALVIDKAINDYDIMDPYTTCGKYQRDVKRNPETYTEAIKYKESSEYLASKDRIQRRLGISYVLTDENITALYDWCRYTSSGIENQFSPWCALFTTDDLKVMEYYGDLRHYYRNGYGTSINEKFGQILLTDLLKNFEEAKNGNGKIITAYFSHATMMDMIYTALGLFKDDSPITGAQRIADRKWRSSKLSVFGANLVAVLNKCNKNNKEDFNIVFYLNEEPLIPICKEGVCTWEEFVDKLKTFKDTNNDFCEFKTVPYI